MLRKYHVLETSFLNDRLVEAGTIVEYDGEASHNLALATDTTGHAETSTKTRSKE